MDRLCPMRRRDRTLWPFSREAALAAFVGASVCISACAESHVSLDAMVAADAAFDTHPSVDVGRRDDVSPDAPTDVPAVSADVPDDVPADVPDDVPVDAPTDVPADAGMCGDGVVEAPEECDDANSSTRDGCSGCRIAPCWASADGDPYGACPAERPWCSDVRAGEGVFCTAGTPGGVARGEPCTSDGECESGRCSADQGRCTDRCMAHVRECGPDIGCTSNVDDTLETGDPFVGWCVRACYRNADCVGARRCRYLDDTFRTGITMCFGADWRPEMRDASTPLGAPCTAHADCVEGLCDGVDGCSALCVTDADCTDPARPFCAEAHAPIDGLRRFPAGATLVYPRVCLPPCGDGVVQAGEECDDGDRWGTWQSCGDRCTWWNCSSLADCPSEAPLCSLADVGAARCRVAISGGAPFGALCTRHDECETAYCSAAGGRCSYHCSLMWGGCPAGAACARIDPSVTPTQPGWCAFECRRDGDCEPGRVCTLAAGNAYCDLPSTTGSAVGSACSPSTPGACASGACLWRTDRTGTFCSSLCVTDADCLDARFPTCRPAVDATAPGMWGCYE